LSKYIDHYYGAVVEVSRGCPFLCEFCDIRILPDNNKSHCKNPILIGKDVENLIKLGKKQFILACDNFIGDHIWAEKVVDELIRIQEQYDIYISIYTWVTINIYKHKRLLRKMRLAGFDLLFIGIESFNKNSLIETAKVQNTKMELISIIQEIQSYGFTIVAGLIFGFDTDRRDCFDLTLDGIRQSGLLSGDPSFLTALPGTPLYRRMHLSK
jgi:Fe-S oxidoreductase